jgi:hypothetical protein
VRDLDAPDLVARGERGLGLGFGERVAQMAAAGIGMPLDDGDACAHDFSCLDA